MTGLDLIKPIKWKDPGPWAMSTLSKASGRTMSLSDLEKRDNLCVWCNSAPLPTRRHRWCGRDCVDTGHIWCYPQDPVSKAYVFINRQKCACVYCGEDFSSYIQQRILKLYARNIEHQASLKRLDPGHQVEDNKITYGQIGYGTGDIWHVDHIVPLHKGGQGIGLDNIQVICVACHRHKTASEAKVSRII